MPFFSRRPVLSTRPPTVIISILSSLFARHRKETPMKNTPVRYYGTTADPTMHLQELFTIHYFEHFRDYPFCGESHDFWELIYVGTGEIIVTDDLHPAPFHLQQGNLLLLQPNSLLYFTYMVMNLNYLCLKQLK